MPLLVLNGARVCVIIMQTSTKADEVADRFYVMVNGQVESAEVRRSSDYHVRFKQTPTHTCHPPPCHRCLLLVQFQGVDNLYCRYCFNFGPDWSAMSGVDVGLSQIAQKANGHDSRIVWNFPIDIVFKSTNPHGWPRLVLSVSCVL